MNRKNYLVLRACFFVFCFFCLSGITVSAASENDHTGKIVKAAYLLSPGFQEGGEGEYKTGQGYEYLQRIAEYAGWSYEYVYGDFGELLQKLSDGEIDIMGNLSYTENRAENILYGHYEQGREAFYLYTTGTSSGIRSDDYSTINGKKIGVSTGSYQEILWLNWCDENSIDCEIVEYSSEIERKEALNSGAIDAVLGNYMPSRDRNTENWRSVLSFGDAPYYFGVSKDKPELLEELNKAQGKILNEDPYYNNELFSKYVPEGTLIRSQLGEDEIEWLKNQNGPLRVGCMDNYLPVSDLDENGSMKGVLPDVLMYIQEEYKDYGPKFEFTVYDDYKQMLSDLKSGEIDIAAPVYGDYWNADKEQICITNPFMSTTMLLLQKGDYSPDKRHKIGINAQSPVQNIYAQIYYSNYDLAVYPSMKETAQALVDGEIDVALCSACIYHVDAILDSNIKELNRSTLPNNVNMAMAVSKQNPELMSFLNRGIFKTGETLVYNSMAVNSNVKKKVTLTDYISENPVTALMISIITILFLIFVIVRLRRAVKKAKTDSMTGLLNKIAMREQIKEEMHRGGVLFMIDIDNFKMVNDVLGHEAGDRVINHFADVLQNAFRSGDLIGRFGGDEFMVFLPGKVCSEEIIRQKFEQLRSELAFCAVFEENSEVVCSISAGILLLQPNSGISYTDAFEKADMALYEAKKKGKNTYWIVQ